MKTSNILLTLTFLVVLIGLTAFNLKLKCAYNKGDYKSAYYGMSLSPVSGIKRLNVTGSNKVTLVLKQGEEEGVWRKNKSEGTMEWHQDGDVLTIGLTKAAKEGAADFFYDQIIVVLKDLEELNTSGYLNNTDSRYDGGSITIEGFNLAKLALSVASGARVTMDSVIIDTLTAIVGDKDLGYAGLIVGSGSKIKSANFEVPGEGELTLDDPTIEQVRYRLSDKTNVSLKGKLLEKLNN